MKTVLFFQTGTPETARNKFAGVCAYAKTRDWDVKFVESSSSGFNLKKTLSFWSPAGCIVEASGGAKGLEPRSFGSVPVVYQCHDPKAIRGMTACVTSDSAAIARDAAHELSRIGMTHFAFVPWPKSVYWSDVRRDEFRAELESLGFSCEVFVHEKSGAQDAIALQRRLRSWIKKLPKPCGIFAASDETGAQLLAACRAVGTSVPEDIAVIAANNDEQICETCVPPLSSIQLDYRRTGHLAAELLGRMLDGEKVSGHFTVPPGGIVRRASSRLFRRHDKAAKLAVETIRRRACSGLRPRDVFALFDCSRRLAEMRFKAATGHTVTEEIQNVRMEEVRRLLARPDVPISAIASRCGWPSESYLRRLFRRIEGCSLSEARKRLSGEGSIRRQV
jgi:LacI family transcriptional regulator